MSKVSIKQAEDVHNQLREILIKYNSPEFGDCIIDEISSLFQFRTTTDINPEGEFVNDGNDYQLLDYVFHPFNTDEGFTNIEVRDFDDNLIGEIAGLEIPDEEDKEAIIGFEQILKIWLIGYEFQSI